MVPGMDFLAMLGIQDPMQLAQMMAQQNIAPQQMQQALTDPGAASIGALSQPTPQAPPPVQMAGMQAPNMPGAPINDAAPQQVGAKRSLTQQTIQTEFMSAVREGGLTNPHGLAAVAATGLHESGFSPGNAFRTWADPSESGEQGTSGGILSWRGPRLAAMQRFAADSGDDPAMPSPSAQGGFFLNENPQLISALQAAKSPEEAQRHINNAWRFAGFDREGGEAGRRIATAKNILPKVESGEIFSAPITDALAEKSLMAGPAAGGAQPGTQAASDAAMMPSTPGGSAAMAASDGSTNPVATTQASKMKTLADKLAAIGKGIEVPEAPPPAEPPRLAGINPQVGGGFSRNPQSVEQLFALLGGNAGGGAAAIPMLSQLIKGAG